VRDLAVFGFMLVLVPLAFRHYFSAYLLWAWAGLISLNSYLYGFMMSVFYVQIFALICLGLLLLNKNKEKLTGTISPTSVLFVLVLVHGLLSATFAYPNLYQNWELYTNMVKTLLFCLLMPLIVTSRFRLHMLFLVLGLALGFHGVLDGLKFLASGGSHLASGIAKFGDNNHYAMVLVMALPMIFYLYRYTNGRLLKFGFLASGVLVSLAVVSTNSRGGLLSLMVVALFLLLYGKRKIAALFTISLMATLLFFLEPDQWFNRMATIQSAEQDSSFMGRVTAWKRASAIAVEHPVLGGGYHAGQAPSIFNEFRYKQGLLGFVDTPNVGHPAATHSIYFEVLGDLGFVGLFLFVTCLTNVYFLFKKILNIPQPQTMAQVWARDMAMALMAAMVAYMVGGAALSAAYFELPYILMMMMQTLHLIVLRQAPVKPKPRLI